MKRKERGSWELSNLREAGRREDAFQERPGQKRRADALVCFKIIEDPQEGRIAEKGDALREKNRSRLHAGVCQVEEGRGSLRAASSTRHWDSH